MLIDPMPLADAQLEWLASQPGGVRFVILTTGDHRRDSDRLAARFSAQILAPAGDQEMLDGLAAEVFDVEAGLPMSLGNDIEVFWIRGGKTDAEAALLLKPLRALVFGDAVRSHASGLLRLLPDPKIQDRRRLELDVAAIAARDDFDTVVLGDGDSLFRGGREALTSLVAGFDT